MNYRLVSAAILALLSVITSPNCRATTPGADFTITVNANQKGISIPPEFYGLMTEEINHAYDGGLYAELLQNRNFKADPKTPLHWSVVTDNGGAGKIEITNVRPLTTALSSSLHVTIISTAPGQRVGAANDGYWGIPVKPNTTYRLSFFAEAPAGYPGAIHADIENLTGGAIFAQSSTNNIARQWAHYNMTLKTGDLTASEANRLVIWGDRAGSFRLSDVSLFPPTFNNRPNGNRIDLMEKLAALKPAFLRMPGGNYLDPGHYIWKDTIGPLQNRPGSPGAWSYPVTQGLGLLEMFEWCEDLHMTPVLAVSDGRGWLAANGNISPLVQDALDEIDYAVGPASSKWGAVRAQDGHPAPFRIKYVEIGNEDFFDKPEVYNYRFSKFYDAIRAKYPQLLIIATRRDVKGRTPDVVDEHYYRTISEMESSAYQYDDYPRKGPKIFVGEWASQDVDSPWDNPDAKGPTPSMNAALGDAAWLTGMERNCDIVSMESYAPLLTNVNPGARQWSQNLIGYDALSSFCSPSYYVQQMFANYRGAVEIPTVQLVGGKAARLDILAGGVGVGTWNTQAEFENPVVTRRGSALTPKNSSNGFSGWTEDFGIWKSEKNIAAQTSAATYSREATIHPDWTDYTYKVRARKTSGAEGFLIMFHVRDNNNFLWWNIGGWGNTRTQIERTRDGEKQPLGPSIPMKIDSGKWYDIEINVNGPEVSCYLDGKLIVRTVDRPQRPYLPIFSSASMNKMSGSIYLHLVNVSSVRHAVALNFGSAHISQRATGEILSGSPTAVNSLSQPAKVAPKPVNISNASARFTYNMPADSVNVIRFSTR